MTALENLPSRRRRAPTTLRAVRAELWRLFLDARHGTVSAPDAARLGYLLSLIGRLIESGELERRIEALEAEARST
jgi:hypothetical protein